MAKDPSILLPSEPLTAAEESVDPASVAAYPGKLRCLILVPAFNEGASVRQLVLRLKRAVPDYDILVIDDGSTDDTVRRVPRGTTVVTLPFNLGIGGAMQTGYRYAALHGYDVAVQVDGDGQHRPRDVRKLVEQLAVQNVDLLVGSRFLERTRYRQTLPRVIGAWFLRGVLRTLTGVSITDCTSGFRATSRRAIRAFAHWYPQDYPEPEVLLLLHRAGYRLGEVSVQMRQRQRGNSSIRPLDGLYYVIKVTVCLILDLVRKPWPQGKVLDAGGGTAQSYVGPVARGLTASTASAAGLAARADAAGRSDPPKSDTPKGDPLKGDSSKIDLLRPEVARTDDLTRPSDTHPTVSIATSAGIHRP